MGRAYDDAEVVHRGRIQVYLPPSLIFGGWAMDVGISAVRRMDSSAFNCCTGHGEGVHGSLVDGWPGMDMNKAMKNGRWDRFSTQVIHPPVGLGHEIFYLRS